MKEFSIVNILETLKTRLDENSLLHVQCRFGIYPKKGFVFNSPILIDKLESLIFAKGLNLPRDYKELLLLHNGAKFFTYEYGHAFCLYSIEEMIDEYNKMLYHNYSTYHKENCYPIGYVTDIGPILMDHSKLKQTDKESMFLIGIETIDFCCDLKTWLERMIIAEGNLYWEWHSKVVENE